MLLTFFKLKEHPSVSGSFSIEKIDKDIFQAMGYNYPVL